MDTVTALQLIALAGMAGAVVFAAYDIWMHGV